VPERFHWIVPGKLAAMALPGLAAPIDEDLADLHGKGVRAVATLTERPLPEKARAASPLLHKHIPIVDFDVPSIDQVRDFCAWADERIAKGEPVAVHCFAGLGRTGLMIACWLVREPGRTTERVLYEIRKLEPGYVQTAEQENFVSIWESTLR
jgi:atypical dual specificity phosphatase